MPSKRISDQEYQDIYWKRIRAEKRKTAIITILFGVILLILSFYLYSFMKKINYQGPGVYNYRYVVGNFLVFSISLSLILDGIVKYFSIKEPYKSKFDRNGSKG